MRERDASPVPLPEQASGRRTAQHAAPPAHSHTAGAAYPASEGIMVAPGPRVRVRRRGVLFDLNLGDDLQCMLCVTGRCEPQRARLGALASCRGVVEHLVPGVGCSLLVTVNGTDA
jgi:hypothetical protein